MKSLKLIFVLSLSFGLVSCDEAIQLQGDGASPVKVDKSTLKGKVSLVLANIGISSAHAGGMARQIDLNQNKGVAIIPRGIPGDDIVNPKNDGDCALGKDLDAHRKLSIRKVGLEEIKNDNCVIDKTVSIEDFSHDFKQRNFLLQLGADSMGELVKNLEESTELDILKFTNKSDEVYTNLEAFDSIKKEAIENGFVLIIGFDENKNVTSLMCNVLNENGEFSAEDKHADRVAVYNIISARDKEGSLEIKSSLDRYVRSQAKEIAVNSKSTSRSISARSVFSDDSSTIYDLEDTISNFNRQVEFELPKESLDKLTSKLVANLVDEGIFSSTLEKALFRTITEGEILYSKEVQKTLSEKIVDKKDLDAMGEKLYTKMMNGGGFKIGGGVKANDQIKLMVKK